ncbi:MAG TPA: CotH kinase family protein [Gemmataceae bacterium]|nr:CotH kinase family protein [Gemmataceae bacterium]
MNRRVWLVPVAGVLGFLLVWAASDARTQHPGGKDFGKGPGGFGPPGGQERKLVKEFDKNGDGWLNKEERQAAREFLKKDGGRGPGGFGPPGGPKGFARGEPGKPGPKVTPAEVKSYPDATLYEPTVLRTLLLEFENPDWEAELQDFHGTDVDVPATLIVDDKKYPKVGVHFRGMSSYGMVPMGSKRSFNLALDLADPKQRLYGYKTLNLLNSHEDPSFLSTVLYSHIARQYIPTPKANFVKVVINGESWGVYPNVQQFNKEFLAENYKTTKGARWKVRGSPGSDGGLYYVGENVADYKRRYEIKSEDNEKSWKDLIALCRILTKTPPEQLEEALKPILDIDGALWFLALDVALVNNDGYWVRASDYSIYQDPQGKFHIIPHDMNEAFTDGMGFGPPGGPGGPGGFMMRLQPGVVMPLPLQDALQLSDEQKKQLAELQKDVDGKLDKILDDEQRGQLKALREGGPPGGFPGGPPDGFPGGPGRPGMGPGGGGVQLDPLVGLTDVRKPLRSKLLAVPSLRAKYLANVRTIAEKSLDWKSLGPVVGQYRSLILKEVEADTRKLDPFEAFLRATDDAAAPGGLPMGRGPGAGLSLRAFADQRRTYLLNHPEVKRLAP